MSSKKNILIFGSNSDIARYLIKNISKSSNLFLFSSKGWFDLANLNLDSLFQKFETKIKNVEYFDEVFYFNWLSDGYYDKLNYQKIIYLFNINLIGYFYLVNTLYKSNKLKNTFIFSFSSVRSLNPWSSPIYASTKVWLNNIIKYFAKNYYPYWIFINFILWPVDTKNISIQKKEILKNNTLTKELLSPKELVSIIQNFPRSKYFNGSFIPINILNNV